MIEKLKTVLLVALVGLSLIQSYLLVYSFPTIGATVQTEQEYITAERMGETARIDDLLFPEQIVLHMGGDRHAALYPDTGFYDRIYNWVLSGEYRNFRRVPGFIRDWDDLRKTSQGVELRFGGGIPVSLLQKKMSLDGDFYFLGDSISSIWLLQRKFQGQDVSEVYFFSSDGETIYEPVRAAFSPNEIQEMTALGSYMPAYTLWRNEIYIPSVPIEAAEYTFDYTSYSPQQMQRSLFFDPDRTRYLEDRNGSVIYTDGKRGLQLESGDTWMVFTDPVPPQDSPDNLADNALAALQFVNQHGGWDGQYRFLPASDQTSGRTIAFQQYYERYPLIGAGLRYGRIVLQVKQGTPSIYERSLLTRDDSYERNAHRWLPGGERLRIQLETYARSHEVEALLPALSVSLTEDRKLYMEPVWAVRLADGTFHSFMKAMPRGTVVELPADAPNDKPVSGVPASGGTDEETAGEPGDSGEPNESEGSADASNGNAEGESDASAAENAEANGQPAGPAAGNNSGKTDDADAAGDGAGSEAGGADGAERDASDAGLEQDGGGNLLPTTEIIPSDSRR